MNGAGGAAGMLFGGIITETLSWRWVLLINPPIGIATAVVAWAVVADRRRGEARQSFDVAGAVTLTLGQMVLVYGVVEAGLRGPGAGLALGPILAGLCVARRVLRDRDSLRVATPIPFKDLTKSLQVANMIVLLFSAALFPMWYVSSLYLQQVLGLSPLHAGLCFLPMALTIMVVARSAGKLVSRFGVRAVLSGGLLMMTAGMLLFTKIAASGSAIVYVIVPGLLVAAGIGMSIVPSTIAATQGAKQGQAGLASGLVNTSRQVGGGLGHRGADHAGHVALEPPDRPRPRRAAVAHRWLPARLLHRRRPVRRRRSPHADARSASGTGSRRARSSRVRGPGASAGGLPCPDRGRRGGGDRGVHRGRLRGRRLARSTDRRLRHQRHV